MPSLKGQLLVAAESLTDPNFHRSVILMFDHTENGAGGIILNRPTGKTVRELSQALFNEKCDWNKAIHLGGPVVGPLAVAHTLEEYADMEVFTGLYGTLAAPKVLDLIRQKAEPSLVLFNYSGWGAGQLESELLESAWKVWPARLEHVFWTGRRDLWASVQAEINGSNLGKLLGVKHRPADPSAN